MANKSSAKRKFETVLGEFKAGTLRSSSGDKVTDKDQALAIAFSEARAIQPSFGKGGKRPRGSSNFTEKDLARGYRKM